MNVVENLEQLRRKLKEKPKPTKEDIPEIIEFLKGFKT